MPEGDTIHRTAARLRPALAGRRLLRFEAPRLVGPRPRPGEVVEAVDAVGKHLLIRFSGGLTVRTHLRMTGSWHLYRDGEAWRRPRHLARCVIAVDGWQAVCFSAPVVTSHPTAAEGDAGGPLDSVGPDLCRPDADQAPVVDDCVARMAALHPASARIGDVLLDQRVAGGVGNVYRSEVCWAVGVDPRTPLGAVPLALRRRLVATASRLLRANLDRPDRSTVAGGGLAVYGRAGRPCRRCGTTVRSERGGAEGRVVFWCPTCQPGRSAAPVT